MSTLFNLPTELLLDTAKYLSTDDLRRLIESHPSQAPNIIPILNEAIDLSFQHHSILWAAQQGHIKLIQILINNGADVNSVSGVEVYWGGWTALHHASDRGHAEAIRLILGNGADIDPRAHNSLYTPLHCAATMKRVDAVRALLDGGADPNLCDSGNRSPLVLVMQLATNQNREYRINQLAEVLLERGTDLSASIGTAFHLAVSLREHNLVQMMMRAVGKDIAINSKNSSGETPLHLAARQGCYKLCEMLIENGAAVNVQDGSGQTPLHVSRRKDILNLLLKRGANYTILDNCDATPFQRLEVNDLDVHFTPPEQCGPTKPGDFWYEPRMVVREVYERAPLGL